MDASQDSETEREDPGGGWVEGRVVWAALGPGRVEISGRIVQRLRVFDSQLKGAGFDPPSPQQDAVELMRAP